MTDEIRISRDAHTSDLELWNLLRAGWKAIAWGLVLGVAAALAGLALIPKKYEAVALIRVGQISKVNGHTVVREPIESPTSLVERMALAQFQRRVAEALNDQRWLQDIDDSALSKAFSVVLLKGNLEPNTVPLIELRAWGPSTDVAKRKLNAVTAELVKSQSAQIEAAQAQLRADLDLARLRLANNERTLVELTRALQTATTDRFSKTVLTLLVNAKSPPELLEQRQIVMAMEEALRAPNTQPTHLIEGAFAVPRPIFPKPAFLLLAGIVSGLLMGILWVLWSDRWRLGRP